MSSSKVMTFYVFVHCTAPLWRPSWILEKPPRGFAGTFTWWFLMTFWTYAEKISLLRIISGSPIEIGLMVLDYSFRPLRSVIARLKFYAVIWMKRLVICMRMLHCWRMFAWKCQKVYLTWFFFVCVMCRVETGTELDSQCSMSAEWGELVPQGPSN